MATYTVCLSTYANTAVEVEAESLDEAIRLVASGDVDMPWLCHQCAGSGTGPSLDLGDDWKVTAVTGPDGEDWTPDSADQPGGEDCG